MKSIINVLCGLSLFGLISVSAFGNEPTTVAPTTGAPEAAVKPEATEKVAKKAGKKAKKAAKEHTDTHPHPHTETAPAGEAHPTGN